jgi:serine/threonine protein kinase
MSFDVELIQQIGKYPVTEYIAEGGMAWVFKVKDRDLFDAPRALKLLKPEAAEGDDYQRFLAEAQILATIQHPNLVHVFDFGQDPATGCHFYTMDYIEGKTLSDITPDWFDDLEDEDEEDDEYYEEEDGEQPDAAPERADVDPNVTTFINVQTAPVKSRYTVRDVCEYFCGVLAAVARLHRENVVHRDIKPENIFLTVDGIAVLGDLGIAKGRYSSGITEIGRVPGTPLYMSPEHARGDPTSARSDIFSLGLSLYAVLSGETVYEQHEEVDATDSQDVLRYLLWLSSEEEEFDFVFDDSIPDSICDVIEKACAMNEADRYSSADDFHEDLRNAIDGVSRPGVGGIRPAVAAAIAIPILALAGYFGMQVISQDDNLIKNRQALEQAEKRAGKVEEERLVRELAIDEERQLAKGREEANQGEMEKMKAALQQAQEAADPQAINAAALELARARADQAADVRRAEEARIAAERQQAKEREEAAKLELAALRQEFKEAQSAAEQARIAAAKEQAALAQLPSEDAGLRNAMARYESAYEERSIEDLNQVWSMSRFERAQVQRLFDDCERIMVQISLGDANINGDTARVDYDETIVFRDCAKTRPGNRFSELSASLALRDDQWQIKNIRKR